jgi:hypothetical protein
MSGLRPASSLPPGWFARRLSATGMTAVKPPAMKTPALATVYLDNEVVGLMGDPRPLVAKVVVAAGKDPRSVRVLRAASPGDRAGTPVHLEDVIDRAAEPAKPIYLTSRPDAAEGTRLAPDAMRAPSRAAVAPPGPKAGKRSLGIFLPPGPRSDGRPLRSAHAQRLRPVREPEWDP